MYIFRKHQDNIKDIEQSNKYQSREKIDNLKNNLFKY